MKRRLRIAVLTAGRFHVLDLARELDALGHEVRFYSYVPKARAVRFGLPERCHVNLVPSLLPLLAWEAKRPRWAPRARERLIWWALNRAVIRSLKDCDVVIAMSGIYLEALQHARQRFGARIILERGSKHVISQDRILAGLESAERPSLAVIERELAGYALADVISIPSSHVERSFRDQDPQLGCKCVVNPYGVDLNSFPAAKRSRPEREVTFVYAGSWSLRKGCDLLAQALPAVPHARLLHAGGIGDYARSQSHQVTHLGHVDQARLPSVYESGDAFVLASREDGFGMVLSQALASGLPVICTSETGGPDLRHTPALADRIEIAPSNEAPALASAMTRVITRLRAVPGFEQLTETDREALSWSAYGRRYDHTLASL